LRQRAPLVRPIIIWLTPGEAAVWRPGNALRPEGQARARSTRESSCHREPRRVVGARAVKAVPLSASANRSVYCPIVAEMWSQQDYATRVLRHSGITLPHPPTARGLPRYSASCIQLRDE
jgi:hypothetical protein